MAFAKRNRMALQSVIGLILVCLFAFAGTVSAEPDYKELKAEIKKLEQAVDDARKARNDADTKLADNRKAQEKAQGNQLKALKDAATGLRDTAEKKADELSVALQSLASKQGELRGTAAAHAVKQLTLAGDIDVRVGEAANALDDWSAALGSLPDVPPLRSLEGIDPDDQPEIRKDDKKKLEAFEKWAIAEEARIDKEITQAKEIVDAEPKLKATNDGGAELVSSAKSLKTTLEKRKKDVGDLRKSAKDLLKQIK